MDPVAFLLSDSVHDLLMTARARSGSMPSFFNARSPSVTASKLETLRELFMALKRIQGSESRPGTGEKGQRGDYKRIAVHLRVSKRSLVVS